MTTADAVPKCGVMPEKAADALSSAIVAHAVRTHFRASPEIVSGLKNVTTGVLIRLV